MRDPKRFDKFYDELKRVHKEHFPDWRFGQFMINFMTWYGDPFYLEEDTFMEKINEFITYYEKRGY